VRGAVKLDTADIERARRVLDDARLERLLDVPNETHGKPALEYLGVLNSRVWNANHAALAAFSIHGLLPHCITLNCDLLIEEASCGAQGR